MARVFDFDLLAVVWFDAPDLAYALARGVREHVSHVYYTGLGDELGVAAGAGLLVG